MSNQSLTEPKQSDSAPLIVGAESALELELLLTIGLLHLQHHYKKHPIRFILAKLHILHSDVGFECAKLAKLELSSVNYDYWEWEKKYGDRLLK